MASAKRYCFTLNNYTEDEYSALRNNVEAHCSYGIIGRETGEEGTRHLQGFCIFVKRISFQTCKDRLDPRVHVEIANGTPRQNRVYCSKDGDFWEHGECPNSGASSGKSTRDETAKSFVSAMEQGRPGLVRFADEFPGAYYFTGSTMLRNYLSLQEPKYRSGIEVFWFYGVPGSGKSKKAHEDLPDAYIKDPRTKWWNGYKLEDSVIIDDFGPGGIDINHLLRWFDRYKCYVEVKGDMVPLYATKFIVTSNFSPESVFSFAGEPNPQLPALLRRIKLLKFGYLCL